MTSMVRRSSQWLIPAADDGVTAPGQRQPDQALDHEPERPRREQAYGGLERGIETGRHFDHVPHGPARVARRLPLYFRPEPAPRPAPSHQDRDARGGVE